MAETDDIKKEEEQIDTELEKCKKERDEYLAGWQRAKADFINYKKEEMDRLQRSILYTSEEYFRELIHILDNFNLAIEAMEKQGHVEKGVYMIKTQCEDFLKKYGVSRIAISLGDMFSPTNAEAVTTEASDLPEGAITEIIEDGYMYNEKVLRPACVKVSKGKNEEKK